jgi:2-oxoisovalerate dehydrogenase E2 component (dihydrolipoyl transacylase)
MSDVTTDVRLQTFSMPDVGEGLTEAEILQWHVAVGDMLTVNQVMAEIETAKAAVELPSPFAGRVHALLVAPGVTVDVGTPIITVDTDPGASEPARPAAGPVGSGVGPATDPAGAKIGEMTADGRIATLVGYTSAAAASTRRRRRPNGEPPRDSVSTREAGATRAPAAGAESALAQPAVAESAAAIAPTTHVPHATAAQHAPLAAPPVRKFAKDLGVDLASVTPSRADGVISRADVEAAAEGTPPSRAGASATRPAATDRDQRLPVKGIRKATAAAMVASAFTAPHVTEFLTVDVTPMMELRERLRRRPEFADVKLTPLAFAARAVCLAARRTPEINAVFESASLPGGIDHIVIKRDVHLGIAAATPRGLIVPVVHDADQLDLAGVAAALQDLTDTARSGHTSPEQMSGGTFTITNVGVFGVDTGTPIINPGQSAILALGSIKDAPWVVDGQLAVRKVCQLALSFDHRVVDGQQGSQFLADVGALLADPGLALAF